MAVTDTVEASTPAAVAPERPAGYSDPNIWETRYEEQEGTFDWYAGYAELGPVFTEFCPADQGPDLMMLGCGNSALSGEMYEAGYKKIVNIDISASAVSKMQEQFKNLDMEWLVMDATAMTFEDSRFDLVVDKGTLDAMMHGGEVGEGLVLDMTAEVWRTLRPGGQFILVSHNGERQPILDQAVQDKHGSEMEWDVLDVRKCPLSPQAMLINILRSMLKGRPLREGFRDPKMLRDATVETKFALKKMQFLEAFRLFKAKKARAASQPKVLDVGSLVKVLDGSDATGRISQSNGHAFKVNGKWWHKSEVEAFKKEAKKVEESEEEDDKEAADPRRQPWCWVYVLRKPQSS